jgi:hypothetical protein
MAAKIRMNETALRAARYSGRWAHKQTIRKKTECLGRETKILDHAVAYLPDLAEACQADHAVEHPRAQVADSPLVLVAGCLLDQAVAYQRAPVEDCQVDPVAVF